MLSQHARTVTTHVFVNLKPTSQRGVMGALKRIGAASTGAFRVRDWYGARWDSASFMSGDRLGFRRRGLLLAGGVILAVVCGRQALLRTSSSRR